MKKIGFGISVLLFALLLRVCSSGTEAITLSLGVVGLLFSFLGFLEK
jgi:hypothetical protein